MCCSAKNKKDQCCILPLSLRGNSGSSGLRSVLFDIRSHLIELKGTLALGGGMLSVECYPSFFLLTQDNLMLACTF